MSVLNINLDGLRGLWGIGKDLSINMVWSDLLANITFQIIMRLEVIDMDMDIIGWGDKHGFGLHVFEI